MSLLIVIPLFMGVVAYWFPQVGARAVMLATQVAILFVSIAHALVLLRSGETVREPLGGTDPALNIELLGTGTSMSLVVLTALLMLGTAICALKYANQKFVLLLLILQSVVNALFLTDDVFNVFVLLEVLTMIMVLLNLFIKERRSIYDALYYLIIQIVGMSFFLFGLAYLYRAVGQLNLSLIAAAVAGGGVTATQLLVPMALMLTGLALKLGLFPLLSYVPRFYGNPGAPVVVLMLSSAVVSTAVMYWIARLTWAFEPVLDFRPVLLVLGFATAVVGAVKALAARDARILLAFSTVSQAGLMLIALGSGTLLTEQGFITHLFAHALAKALLFFAVGALGAQYGSTNLNFIRQGIWQQPVVGAAFAIGALSMLGFPLTAGGVSKYWIVEGIGSGWEYWGLWLVNLGTALVMVKLLLPPQVFSASPSDFDMQPGSQTSYSTEQPRYGFQPASTYRTDTISGAVPQLPRYVQGLLLAISLIILLFGFGGLDFSITWLAFLTKAWQIALLTLLALLLTYLWRHNGFSARYPQLQQFVGTSIALPDACLMVAVFFAGMVFAALLLGVA